MHTQSDSYTVERKICDDYGCMENLKNFILRLFGMFLKEIEEGENVCI